MPNRLARSHSPYLLQHKDNPVNWYPWGDEAFERAQSEDKPIFLSVGYSACHWCHVMEHESFEDEEIADILNENFVSIKVDREERPDIDEAYMTAVQLSSGRGGWPMSVFLASDRKPFFAGTYWPKEDRNGNAGFKTIITQIAKGWASKRSEFDKAADEFSAALTKSLVRDSPVASLKLDRQMVDNALEAIAADFDQQNGGFGNAPKFPPHTCLDLLLDYAVDPFTPDDLAQGAAGMAFTTLEAMAAGGIRDHVGGGFHRYSTDAEWILPHFEKMLYDNALLLRLYAKGAMVASQISADASMFFRGVAFGIVEWLEREMKQENGLYGAALDADSEGEEGKFYVWTEQEIRDVLGVQADRFTKAYSVKAQGNYRDEATGELTGKNVLVLGDAAEGDFTDELLSLQLARNQRPRPGFDNKQIVAWNALLLSAFAIVGETEKALDLANGLLAAEKAFGGVPRQVVKGNPVGEGFLEDHAALTLGLIDLALALEYEDHPSVGELRNQAVQHAYRMVEMFYDEDRGGFFHTSAGHEELFGRTKPIFDQPVPSGNALGLQVLIRMGDLTGAEKTLEGVAGWLEAAPQGTCGLLGGLLAYLQSTAAEPDEDANLQKAEIANTTDWAQDARQETPTVLTTGVGPIESKPAPADVPKVSVSLSPKEIHSKDGKGRGVLKFEIPEGLHINSSDPPARWLIPTKVEIHPLKASLHFPTPENDRYEGSFEVPFTVNLPEKEEGADFEVTVSYQACTDSECHAPEEKRIGGVILRV